MHTKNILKQSIVQWKLWGIIYLLFMVSIVNGNNINSISPFSPLWEVYNCTNTHFIQGTTPVIYGVNAGKTKPMPPLPSMMMNTNCFIPVDDTYIALPKENVWIIEDIDIPFALTIGGISYDQFVLSTYGYVGMITDDDSGYAFIPFFGNIDIQYPDEGQIYYKVSPTNIIVTWSNVGYGFNNMDKLNTFQVIISTPDDPITGIGNTVSFRYGDMQWATFNDPSGFGGDPVTIGVYFYSTMESETIFQVGTFNQDNSDYDGPYGDNDGVHYLDNKCFDFFVGDNTPPISNINLPDLTIECGQTVEVDYAFTGPEVGQAVEVTVNTNAACDISNTMTSSSTGTITITGSECNYGQNTITITAVDDGTPNLTTEETFIVTVVDTEPPVPDVATLPTVTGECDANVSAPTATDNCEGTITATTTDPTIYTAQGTHTVTWTYDDGNGNTSSQTQTIIIDDTTPPLLTCPSDIVVDNQAGECGRYVYYPTPTVEENCQYQIESYVYLGEYQGHFYYASTIRELPFDASSKSLALGGHLATINSEEESDFLAGALASIPGTYFNTWIDFTDTEIEGVWEWGTGEPVNYTNWFPGHPIAAEYVNWTLFCRMTGLWRSWGGLAYADYVVEFEQHPLLNLANGLPSGSFFPIGETLVEWEATDVGGNTSSCSFTVTVNDTEAPIITNGCPETIEACGAQNIWWLPPTATDNCEVMTSSNYSPGDYFSVGTHIVEYIFEDLEGNSVSCEFEVVIHPLPDVEIISSITPMWCQGVSVLTAEVNNLYSLAPPVTYQWSHGLGSSSAVIVADNGVYTVQVTDNRGCTTIVTYEVNEDLSEVLSAYTIVVDEELEMHESQVFNGGIGVMDADEVEVEDNSTIYDFLLLEEDELDVDESSTINEVIDGDFELPLPPFKNNPYHNNQILTVAAGSTVTLDQSNYGYVKVYNGATLIIANPTLYMKRLRTYNNVTIIFEQPTELIVKNSVKLGRFGNINPTGENVILYGRENVEIAQGSDIVMDIYCDDELEINDSGSNHLTTMTGMYIAGESVKSGDNVEWNWNLNCDLIANNTSLVMMNPSHTTSPTINTTQLSVFPNPTGQYLTIDLIPFLEESVEIKVVDILGQVIMVKNISKVIGSERFDLQQLQLSKGLYIISVENGANRLSAIFMYEN